VLGVFGGVQNAGDFFGAGNAEGVCRDFGHGGGLGGVCGDDVPGDGLAERAADGVDLADGGMG